VGLWRESGAMQRHKFLGEAAEAPEISLDWNFRNKLAKVAAEYDEVALSPSRTVHEP
jgi:hypothetical protein